MSIFFIKNMKKQFYCHRMNNNLFIKLNYTAIKTDKIPFENS